MEDALLIGLVVFFIFLLTLPSRKSHEKKKKEEELKKQLEQEAIEKAEFEKKNLENYIAQFPPEKMVYKHEPVLLNLAGAKYHMGPNGFRFKTGDQAILLPEPDNEYDKNAVRVINLSGHVIGYIPKEDAEEILEDLNNRYYYEVTIKHIHGVEFNDIWLSLVKYSDKEEQKADPEFSKKWEEERRAENENREKVLDVYFIGLDLEREKQIDEAINCYENVIESELAPDGAYERLAINYRKRKDYDNEIRVIGKWLNSYDNENAQGSNLKEAKAKITKRLNRAIELKSKNT